ncbi:MAG: hypothetical protein KDA99_21815, partial [Planctomycetales bacterium]|nr:hypothetical protein [Planctomycetales bacterium]
MSSPLSWFRKNERLLLGIFGVALIIVFTISLGTGSDPLIDWLSGGGRRGARENNVVVTWKNGNLRESDFEVMRQQRQRVLPLTQTIAQEAYVKGATELSASQIPPTIDEDHLMETRLLATEAERMGIVVSDDAVADYLYRLGAGKLSNNDLQEIMLRVTEGRMTQDQLMKILRYELSAMMVRAMAQSGTFPASPDSLWDFFNRLERRVRAELLPYPAEQFLAEVGEPKDADVRDLYEQHKDDLSNPATGDIGFKRRKKVAFQYFKVSYAPFLATAKAEISDEEVAKYYEEHKDDFRTTTPATTGTDNVSDQTSAPPSDTDIVPADTNLNQPEMTDLDTESPETTEPETTEPETTEPETTEPETT